MPTPRKTPTPKEAGQMLRLLNRRVHAAERRLASLNQDLSEYCASLGPELLVAAVREESILDAAMKELDEAVAS